MASGKDPLEVLQDGCGEYLRGLIGRCEEKRTFIQRVIYPMYQDAQQERWKSENRSQGQAWSALDSNYSTYKRKAFESFPGEGKIMMVATGRLFSAVRGPARGFISESSKGIGEHRKLITSSAMQIFVTTPYAQEAAEVRPFMEFSQDTIQEWVEKFRDWLNNSKE